MISIRTYKPQDFEKVQKLIHHNFETLNPTRAPKEAIQSFVDSLYTEKFEKRYKDAPICFVAVDGKGSIVGVIRGDENRLKNLFVKTNQLRKGIARKLFDKYEKKAKKIGYKEIKMFSSIDAVQFYEAVGCKKTRGSVNKGGMIVQPMMKKLT